MEKLKETIFKFLRLDGIFDHLSGYLEARIELVKIEIREDVAKAIAGALIYMVVFFFATMFMIFFSLGLALFLNRYFQTNYVGFWLVAGFYLLGFLVFLIFRKDILRKFEKRLVDVIKQREK